jgi:hypothetical protein
LRCLVEERGFQKVVEDSLQRLKRAAEGAVGQAATRGLKEG